jgi:multidrug efflux system membrane fusion protein
MRGARLYESFAALLLLLFLACHRAAAPESVTAAETAPQKEANLGVVVASLDAAPAVTGEVLGYATVLDLTELFASASQYASADAQRQQAAAHLQSTSAELQRQRVLNADDHNVSDRAVQETAALVAADAGAVRAAEVSLRAAENAARQRWGAVVASGVIRNAAWAQGLSAGQTALLEVAFSADGPPPATLTIESHNAHYLAQTPRVNARLLRPSHYYLAGPASAFPVGMTIDIQGTSGRQGGVVVPNAAVVWVDGVATIFIEDKPGHYEKRAISAATHVPAGFVETSLAPGTRVVVQGAQQLLAE